MRKEIQTMFVNFLIIFSVRLKFGWIIKECGDYHLIYGHPAAKNWNKIKNHKQKHFPICLLISHLHAKNKADFKSLPFFKSANFWNKNAILFFCCCQTHLSSDVNRCWKINKYHSILIMIHWGTLVSQNQTKRMRISSSARK